MDVFAIFVFHFCNFCARNRYLRGNCEKSFSLPSHVFNHPQQFFFYSAFHLFYTLLKSLAIPFFNKCRTWNIYLYGFLFLHFTERVTLTLFDAFKLVLWGEMMLLLIAFHAMSILSCFISCFQITRGTNKNRIISSKVLRKAKKRG